jgi:hypothetical protein
VGIGSAVAAHKPFYGVPSRNQAPAHPGQLEGGCSTPSQLDVEAQITTQDIADAQQFARRYFTPLFNAMLNAEAEPGGIEEG